MGNGSDCEQVRSDVGQGNLGVLRKIGCLLFKPINTRLRLFPSILGPVQEKNGWLFVRLHTVKGLWS